MTSTTSFDDPATSTLNESYLGIARSHTQDPGGANLTTTESFEAPGAGSYLRRTGRQLPSGAGSNVTYSYYAPAEGPVSAVCGVAAGTAQLGFLKQTTQADPDGAGAQTPIVRQYVYDAKGRQAGYRASTSVSSEPWTCTTFDDAGRPATVAYPAWGAQAARTVSYNYRVGGDPTKTSVADSAGTVSTTGDWAGRTTAYQDVWGQVTNTSYDNQGRVVQRSNGGGTVGYSYGADDQLISETLNGKPIATPVYDSMSRMTSVSYPSGAGNAGNGTSGQFSFDNRGLPASVVWRDSSNVLITSDAVNGRDLTNRITGYATDGFDVNGATDNYSYDGAGRLSGAVTFAATPAANAAARLTQYNYAATGGCGYATAAGKNSNRTSKVTGTTTVNYCYDAADRLSGTDDTAAGSVSTANGTLAYDTHGNTSILGGEAHVYDIADRHVQTKPVVAPAALLVVGNPTGLTTADKWFKNRLTANGFTVTVGDDNVVGAADANGKALVLITSSTSSATVGTKFKATPTPVMSTAAWGWANMAMATNIGSSATADKTTINITDAANPLAGGLAAGVTTVSTAAQYHGWGQPGASAHAVASQVANPSQVSVFSYDKGATLTDGSVAAGTRLGWFWYTGNTGTATAATASMFDAAVLWASAAPTPVTYTRDATDRIVARSAAGEQTTRNGYSGAGDAPALVLDSNNTVIQATLALPGGAMLSYKPAAPVSSTWSYPGIQGSIAAQSTQTGTKQGATKVFDPDGIPVAGGLPDTDPGNMDGAYLGAAQRPLEHAGGLQPVIEMGARQYHPVLGRFLEIDPVEGGGANDYGYVTDQIGQQDLTGEYVVGQCLSLGAVPLIGIGGMGCLVWDHTMSNDMVGVGGASDGLLVLMLELRPWPSTPMPS
jgi:RHS repeat-associated protein